MKKLKDHKILILGASGDIGSAVARVFAEAGADLILVGRSLKKLESVADVCEDLGVNCLVVPMTFQSLVQLDELAVHLAVRHGFLDGMISCLGAMESLGPIHHVLEKEWLSSQMVNVTLNWKALQAFESLLRKKGRGVALFPVEAYYLDARAYGSVYGLCKKTLNYLIEQFNLDNRTKTMRVQILPLPLAKTSLTQKAFPSLEGDFADPKDLALTILAAYTKIKP